ncbi:hotdog domain-containing protein [Bradyrhizobium zhanjiangense]|uniref:hotdog domain-containing protein n=1 Tax=Bradyrhizobium zhanjiangense TaxID=1325107 RepID=UPI003D3175A4
MGGRVVHGALLVGLMAGAGTATLQSIGRPAVCHTGTTVCVFLRGAHLGETVTATYTITNAVYSKSNCEAEMRASWSRGDSYRPFCGLT